MPNKPMISSTALFCDCTGAVVALSLDELPNISWSKFALLDALVCPFGDAVASSDPRRST